MALQTRRPTGVTAKLFGRFAEESRLAILQTLRQGPRSVSEIVGATGLSQPNTSNHLHCLHCCGIVKRVQDGRRVFYSLADDRIAAFLDLADELVSEVATGVATCTRYGSGGVSGG